MSGKKPKKRRGHYCWCCGQFRPNEQFSGKGHARHLCRKCARLGGEELEYRQALRDMERCIDYNGTILRKRRRQYETFLHHENPRIRAAAQEIVAQRRQDWEEWRLVEREYENYDVVEDILRNLEYECDCINRALHEAAEIDRCSDHNGLAAINRKLAEAAEIDLHGQTVDTLQ